MTVHPLIELANDREVKQAKGFRQVAARLTGEVLAEQYQHEMQNAPRRHDVGQKYLVGRKGTRRWGERARRDEQSLAVALLNHCGDREGLALPDDGKLDLLDHWVPLKARRRSSEPIETTAETDAGQADPHKRVGRIDLFGIAADGRMAVVVLKFVPAQATRGSTGDTPLRALLGGLAACAIATANRDALQAELSEHFDRQLADEPPLLLLLGNSRYWELCRKREAQKGAAWIAELERLGREIEASLGVQVRFLGLELPADPAWEEREGRLELKADPNVAPAWEPSAGKVKPKPKPKAPSVVSEPILEADPTRPMRPYELTGSYAAGDSIEHPTLGTGVVQGVAGPGKIKVIFDGKPRLLVHERPPPPA